MIYQLSTCVDFHVEPQDKPARHTIRDVAFRFYEVKNASIWLSKVIPEMFNFGQKS